MNGKSKLIITGAAIAVIGAVAWAYMRAVTGGDAIIHADAGNADLVARGAPIYADSCAACHGANLEGQPNWRAKGPDGRFPAPPHDRTGHTWHHPDTYLFAVTKRGGQEGAPAGFVSGMPPYAEILTDAEIWAVLAFIKSRWPEEIRTRHAEMTRRAGG